MSTTIPLRFRVRRRTAADWTSVNEVLLDSEIGLETDTRKIKIGDGVTAWNSLGYLVPTILHGATGKTTPVDADELPLLDSAASWGLKKLTLANLKAWLQAIFDVRYASSASSAFATVKKLTDENRASTITLTDDADLHFVMSAGVRYHIRIRLILECNNSTSGGAVKLNFTGTAPASYYIHLWRQLFGSLSSGSSEVCQTSKQTTFSSIPLTNTTGIGLYNADVIFVPTTGGTFSIQFAQAVSNAANLTMLAGSYLEYMTT